MAVGLDLTPDTFEAMLKQSRKRAYHPGLSHCRRSDRPAQTAVARRAEGSITEGEVQARGEESHRIQGGRDSTY